MDVFELLEQKDCMCLGLDIARSEAAIADPSKLVIRKVLPVYMSLDAFLESSIFHLKQNQDNSGAFDLKHQGKLAIGAGRENVTGVLPLFLFKEHWMIAKCKIQPVYGFMATLDPLGYAPAQYFTIPFLVLISQLKNTILNHNESNQQILKLVQKTCSNMVASNLTFKRQILEQTRAFISSASDRTVDVVPDIRILTSQFASWSDLPEDRKGFGGGE